MVFESLFCYYAKSYTYCLIWSVFRYEIYTQKSKKKKAFTYNLQLKLTIFCSFTEKNFYVRKFSRNEYNLFWKVIFPNNFYKLDHRLYMGWRNLLLYTMHHFTVYIPTEDGLHCVFEHVEVALIFILEHFKKSVAEMGLLLHLAISISALYWLKMTAENDFGNTTVDIESINIVKSLVSR